MQRVRLASQLGTGHTGVLYVLDEPTIGLHPRDTGRLLASLRALVEKGNTVVVVEHDSDTICAADVVFDMGPSGGRHGGHLVASGSPLQLLENTNSPTGMALRKPLILGNPSRVRANTTWIEVLGAREHNLKNVHIRVPLGALVVVTGVSGSGKSTFARDVLLRAAREALGLVTDPSGAHDCIQGIEHIQRAIEIDQSPIGRTPRSVPATYVGVWDEIRKLLAGTPEARARGYNASRFSFNVAAGRCTTCDGQGALTIEMAFLPEVLVPCEACEGKRFNTETLSVHWSGKTPAEILDLDVHDALKLFETVPKVRHPLALLSNLTRCSSFSA